MPTASKTESTVYDILPHGKDHLWLITYMKGLQLFDKRSGKIVKQWSHLGTNISNVDASYRDLHQHSKDTILLASNHGLIILNTQSMKWSKIDVSDGMRDNICYDILPSQQKMTVAISTQSAGLCFVNIKTRLLRVGKTICIIQLGAFVYAFATLYGVYAFATSTIAKFIT